MCTFEPTAGGMRQHKSALFGVLQRRGWEITVIVWSEGDLLNHVVVTGNERLAGEDPGKRAQP